MADISYDLNLHSMNKLVKTKILTVLSWSLF